MALQAHPVHMESDTPNHKEKEGNFIITLSKKVHRPEKESQSKAHIDCFNGASLLVSFCAECEPHPDRLGKHYITKLLWSGFDGAPDSS